MANYFFYAPVNMGDIAYYRQYDLTGLEIYSQTSTTVWGGVGAFGSGIDVRIDGRNFGSSGAVLTGAAGYENGNVVLSITDVSWDYNWFQNLDLASESQVLDIFTSGNDKIYGSSGSDVLIGGNGADQVFASNGDDVVYGNRGDDLIYGYEGNDTIYGGQERDQILGNQGDDTLFGNFGDDTVYGGQGSDRIYGGQDQDYLFGNFGDDIIYGNLGNDVLYGGQNNDVLIGGDGNDWMDGNRDNDTLIGGAGADSFVLSAGQDLFRDFNPGEGDKVVLTWGDQAVLADTGSGLNVSASGKSAILEGWSSSNFDAGSFVRYI